MTVSIAFCLLKNKNLKIKKIPTVHLIFTPFYFIWLFFSILNFWLFKKFSFIISKCLQYRHRCTTMLHKLKLIQINNLVVVGVGWIAQRLVGQWRSDVFVQQWRWLVSVRSGVFWSSYDSAAVAGAISQRWVCGIGQRSGNLTCWVCIVWKWWISWSVDVAGTISERCIAGVSWWIGVVPVGVISIS